MKTSKTCNKDNSFKLQVPQHNWIVQNTWAALRDIYYIPYIANGLTRCRPYCTRVTVFTNMKILGEFAPEKNDHNV